MFCSTNGEHRMSVTFKKGWNTLKIVDQTGATDTRRIFATLKN
ncbi:hypothetical protein [Geofilum rhodophaeum]|nr:hypothetical protein [Geofilum rhodophaeum]